MGYGFFRLRFLNEDGTPNPEMAKKALDWAQENLDWVKELKPFALDGEGNWGNNDDEWTDGVDIERTGVPDEIGGWVKQVGDAVGAAVIAASETQDFTESDMDNIGTVAAVYKNGEVEESGYIQGEEAYEEADSWMDERLPKPDGALRISSGRLEEVEDTSCSSVTIPGNIEAICRRAFDGCTNLKDVRYGGTQAQWFMLSAFNKLPETATVHCSDGDAKNPKTATEYAIPEGVTKIGYEAFKGFTSLASVGIPEGVTEIDIGAFKGCTSLASVTIPASVTEIGSEAFRDCTSLASVTIPKGVTKIGGSAFEGCTALAEVRYGGTQAQWLMANGFRAVPEAATVHCSDGDAADPRTATEYTIPGGVTKIGREAFKGFTSLASVSIPEGVTEIDGGAFEGCTTLATVNIPGGVTKIDYDTFSGCTSLAAVTIPGGVTEIGGRAFEGCSSLASISIPGSVTKIGTGAFKGCTSLASVTIPASVTKIGYNVFEGCTSLASVTIPEGVTEIGSEAFQGCTSLASVTIPEGVTEIDGHAFEGCTALKEIRYGGTQAQWFMLDAFRYFPENVAVHCSDGEGIAKGMSEVTIPASVTEIGSEAFKGCTAIKEVRYGGTQAQWFMLQCFRQLPEDVVVHCSDGEGISKGMSEVVIPEGVTKIGYIAFKDCTSLASVTIPEGVTEIGREAFEGCTSLASISIPGSVTAIDNAFYGCTVVKEVRYGGTQAQWFMLSAFNKLPEDVVVHCSDGEGISKGMSEVVIPEGVTAIGYGAFEGCTALASISISGSVTKIGDGAFSGCTALASVTIPEGVTKIGYAAFSGCTALVSVSIPDSVTEIGGYAFKGCTSLASVNIPEGVTAIGEGAFYYCDSLASVSIPASVTEISNYAFLGCTSLAEIHFAGTKEQWAAVEKGDNWNKGVPAKEVLVRKQ